MTHRSHALSFTFEGAAGPADLRAFVDDLLLSVVRAFDGGFLGHAKTIIQADGKSYFASTTGLPPEVEWKPEPDTPARAGRAEVVWIFIPGQHPVPGKEDIRRLLSLAAGKYGITPSSVTLP